MQGSETKEKKPGRAGKMFRSAMDAALVPLLAIFTALVIGGIIIWMAGGNPIQAYAGLFQGAFGSAKALSETAVWATPYILAGLAVALAFRGGLFNIGAEGQLALGAVAAAWVGYALPGLLGITIPAITLIREIIRDSTLRFKASVSYKMPSTR